MVTLAEKLKAVAHLVDAHGMSGRRAFKAIGCCRMAIKCQTFRADDAALRQCMRAIAQRAQSLWPSAPACSAQAQGLSDEPQEALLAVRPRGGRKRAIGT